jgi:hypothetical protein
MKHPSNSLLSQRLNKLIMALVVGLMVALLLTEVVATPQAFATPQFGRTPPVSRSLADFQTPIKDQKDRKVSWAFAGAAALEATYKREAKKHGIELNLDLSEQYIIHIIRAGKLYESFTVDPRLQHENSSSYWDGMGGSEIIKWMAHFAIPEEKYAPYLTQSDIENIRKNTPGVGELDPNKIDTYNATQQELDAFEFSERLIPPDARLQAKYGVEEWGSTSEKPSTDELERIIDGDHEIVVDAQLRRKDIGFNTWDYDPNTDKGIQTLLLIGYDRNRQVFVAKNSGGESDYLNLTYDFVSHNISTGYYINKVRSLDSTSDLKSQWLGFWNVDQNGRKGQLVIRRFADFNAPLEKEKTDASPKSGIKLGSYYQDGKEYDVNGYFTEEGRSLIFYIANDPSRLPPGTLKGQRSELYLFSEDQDRRIATGITVQKDMLVGTALSRDTIPSKPYTGLFNKLRWRGKWDMNYDGRKGTLVIENIISCTGKVSGKYINSKGQTFKISGDITDSNSISITIPSTSGNAAEGQTFELLYHTQEIGVFSGTTYWDGKIYGVLGYQQR